MSPRYVVKPNYVKPRWRVRYITRDGWAVVGSRFSTQGYALQAGLTGLQAWQGSKAGNAIVRVQIFKGK